MEVKSLSKVYKTEYELVHALNDMNLVFPDHGLVFIVGVSGSGKSTLMNMLSGVDTPTEGEVIVEGKSLFKRDSKELFGYRNSYVGLIFQDYNLIEDMNVYDNIKLPLELLGSNDFSIIDDILKKVDIEEIKYSNVNEISSGQMQRVAIARALVKDSAVILADEPTGNLDSKNTKIVMDLLKDISKTRLVVVITHDDDAAHEYGDEIIEIEDGRILEKTVNNEEINNELEVKRDGEFIQPKISFKKQATFTKNFIKANFGRSLTILLLMILISFIGNILCGYVFFNIEKSYTTYQDEYGSEFIKLADTYSGYTVNYNDNHYIDMYEKYYDSNLIEVFGINYYTSKDDTIEEDIFFKKEVTNLIVDDGNFEYIDGESPNAMYPQVNQIAITDYYQECYSFYNDGDTLEIGDTIRLNGVAFKICGIIKTSYENYRGFDRSDLFTSMAFQENLEYYNAFYISSLGQTYWWDNMTFFEEDVKYTIVTKIPSVTKYSRVVMRKLTTQPPSLTSTASFSNKKNGMVSRDLWVELLEMSSSDPIISSYSVSFVCSTRAKYTFSFRTTAMYDSMATNFENKSKYEVIVGTSLFEKYRDKQQMCKFLVRRTDPNYKKILINENVVNQSFTFAKATWNRADSSKYVMIEFIITMILIMTVFAFIMNSITMNAEKKKIGIKYSFGITKKDIVKPYIYEIILYTIIAFITSFALIKFVYPLIVNGLIYTTEQEIKEYYFFYIGYGSILGWDALVYAIMFISLFVMVYKIVKKSPIEIIKDL